MAQHYKTPSSAPVDLALSLVALVWDGAQWLRALVVALAFAGAVAVVHVGTLHFRDAASTWGPSTRVIAPVVLTAAPEAPGE